MIQMTHVIGGYGMTPNAIAQISAKVVMASHFLGLVDSMTPSEQTLWFPHQNVQDPNTWTLSHWLQLQHEYIKLENTYNCVVQESYVVQDPPPPLRILSFSHPSLAFIRLMYAFRSFLSRENLDRSCHLLSGLYLVRL